MLDPDHKPEKTSLLANIVVAVLLTVFAIPLLLTAGCIPAMVLGAFIPKPAIVVGILAAAAISFCLALAYHAATPGHRIGFIAAAIEVVLLCAWLYFFNP